MFLLKIDSCIFRQRTISSKTFFFQSYSFSLREGHNTHDAAVVWTQDHENPEKLLQQNFDHFKRIAVFECVLQRYFQPFSSFYHYLVKDIIMYYAIVMVMPFHFSNNNRNLKCIKQYMIWSFSFLTCHKQYCIHSTLLHHNDYPYFFIFLQFPQLSFCWCR